MNPSFRKLGPYELIDRLAVGGMAEIFLARASGAQGFSKEYVIKLIHPKYIGDAEFIRMLVDEAKLVGSLHHPNIAQVIDFGSDGESHFIVMEYVRGRDLYQILNEAWSQELLLPIESCVYIAKEMAAGLYYAHNKSDVDGRPLNIVHRDISPQNIVVSFLGGVKILDFGVAKAALAARPETKAGIIKGKFRYMSPEQAWGEKLDGRSDVFAIGLCLYEMLTGENAYEEDGDMQRTLLRMREAQFRPITSIRPEVDAQLDAIVMRALARDRNDRYPSAHELEVELARYLHKFKPGFTRMEVTQLLKQLFPEDTADVHAPEPTAIALTGNPTSTTDEITPVGFSDLEVDTDDMTMRQGILSERTEELDELIEISGEFEGESTELYDREAETDTAQELPTAAMSNDKILQLVTQQGGMPTREAARPVILREDDLIDTESRRAPVQDEPVRIRRDTVVGLIENWVPPAAARPLLDGHHRISQILESENGRKFVVPLLGVVLGLFLLLILVLIFF